MCPHDRVNRVPLSPSSLRGSQPTYITDELQKLNLISSQKHLSTLKVIHITWERTFFKTTFPSFKFVLEMSQHSAPPADFSKNRLLFPGDVSLILFCLLETRQILSYYDFKLLRSEMILGVINGAVMVRGRTDQQSKYKFVGSMSGFPLGLSFIDMYSLDTAVSTSSVFAKLI